MVPLTTAQRQAGIDLMNAILAFGKLVPPHIKLRATVLRQKFLGHPNFVLV